MIDDVVPQSQSVAFRCGLFQASQMTCPFFIALPSHLRKRELMDNVLVIVGEVFSQKPLHILKQKCLRRRLSNCSYGVWEHIPLVVHTNVFATDGKWLARRTSGNQIHFTGKLSEIEVADVAFNYSRVTQLLQATCLIAAQCRTSVRVPFQNSLMVKTGVCCS